MRNRIIVGISGASGMPIAAELLRALRETEWESHLIMTRGARAAIPQETDLSAAEMEALADVVHDVDNVGDGPASGSYQTAGMVVVPCSMKTLAGIHSGYSDNLLLRAADVTLKERRRLVLVTRECPMSTIHLRNQYELSQMGAVILPPVLSFYNRPRDLTDVCQQIVGKILDQFGVEYTPFRRWMG